MHGVKIDKSKIKILLNNKSRFVTSCHIFKDSILAKNLLYNHLL